ncbi:MAG: ABC transporter substrate-binding protein [Tissierellia bacterium]|nr:ABC transporter substrate-binding protein [Tissierellia bacterium]MDD4781158.1 ABC transporter substrate-binding protein [Tissierellia bacterium]
MKKLISMLTIIMLLLAVMTGCSNGDSDSQVKEDEQVKTDEQVETNEDAKNESDGEKIKIGIIQPVEHPSLNQIREYIIIGLEEQGLKDKVEIIYKNAQGDSSNINTIVSQFIGDKMDIIVPIGTGAAQSIAAATKDIPIVFAASSFPVEAGLVKDVNKPEANVTGLSDAIDVNEIFSLAANLTPEVKTYGFIYNSGEVNSVAAIEKAKEYCDANGLEFVEVTITSSGDLVQAAQSLVGKVDAIFTPTDNTVASAMPVLAAEAYNADIPVYVGADSMVIDGGFATVGIDYTVLGRQVAAMVKKVVDGESISSIPVETLKEYTKIVNTTTAKEIGIELSEEDLKDFQVIE